MSEIDDMLGALQKSVLSILEAPEAERKGLLTKSVGQFNEAVTGFVGAVAEDAFQQGRVVDLLKFDGMGEGGVLAKGMDHVAGFALVMKQLEFFLESWAGEVEEESGEGAQHAQQQAGGTAHEPPPGLVAAAQWYEMGQQVLKFLVAHATGDDSTDADAGAEPPKDPGTDKGQEPPPAPAATEQKPDEPALPPADGEKEDAGAAPAESGNQTDEDDEKKRAMSKVDGTEGGDLLAKFEAMLNERLEKVAAEKDAELAKAAADNAKLLTEIEALKKSTPAPAKGAVMAVGKSADSNTLGKSDEPDIQAQAERLEKMAPDERAIELIRIAQQHSPLPIPRN